jgi:hypothetical protein
MTISLLPSPQTMKTVSLIFICLLFIFGLRWSGRGFVWRDSKEFSVRKGLNFGEEKACEDSEIKGSRVFWGKESLKWGVEK